MVFGRKKKKKKNEEKTAPNAEEKKEESVQLLSPEDDDSLLAPIDEEEVEAAAAWTGLTEKRPEQDLEGDDVRVPRSEQALMMREQERRRKKTQKQKERGTIIRALLVDVKRQIEAELDNKQTIKTIKLQGKIHVKNQSPFDRIWDLKLKFKGSKGINIKPEYRIAELPPNGTWSENFEMKKTDQAKYLPIKFEERIHTSADREFPLSVFIHGTENPTTLILRVHVLQEMESVTITKKIPSFFSSKPTVRVSKGEATITDQGMFTWKITDIYNDTLLEASISDLVTITDTEVKTTEPTRIDFISKSESDLIDVDEIIGLVKNKSWINSDELDEQPGTWENRLVFQNESSCVVKLIEVEVKDEKNVYLKERLDVMDELIHPNTEWISQPWMSRSKSFPSFNYQVIFTVLPEVRHLAVGTITIDPQQVSVAKVTAERTYNTLDLRSFDTNPLKAHLIVENTGTTPIAEILFVEKFPEHFIIPEQVEAKIKKIQGTTSKKLEYGDYSLVFYPDDREPDHPHEMKFTLNVPLRPKHALILTYDPTADKPPKGKTYEVSGRIQIRLNPSDPPVELTLPRDPIVFRVIHQRHRVSFGKQVREGEKPGEYHVSVWFMNRSDIPMEDVVLQDILPEGFNIIKNSHSSIMKKTKITDGTALRWHFKKIEPGEEITVQYILKGSGAYSPSKIQLS